MEEQLVTLKTVNLAKEKGFDLTSLPYRDIKTGALVTNVDARLKYFDNPEDANMFKALSQSLLQKWLRETYKLHLSVDLTENFKWKCIIRNFQDEIDRDEYSTMLIPFDSYEEALESGLQKVLNYI